MLLLVEAAHDENGKLSYGQPGDQTGDEVRLREVSDKESFTYYFRCPDKTAAKAMAKDAIDVAGNNHVGYAQYGANNLSSRYGLYYAMKTFSGKADFSKLTIYCNVDCSALISDLLNNNGYKASVYMSTSSEVNQLINLGFVKQVYNKDKLEVGDILWRQGHTAIVVSKSDDVGTEEDIMFSKLLTSSSQEKKWSTGAGPLTRKMAYVTVSKKDLGFKQGQVPGMIVVQQKGEILSLSQWIRAQSQGFLFVSDKETTATSGVPVGTAEGFFNPDADTILIPVRFPNQKYHVMILPF